jgi:hypothetical protein
MGDVGDLIGHQRAAAARVVGPAVHGPDVRSAQSANDVQPTEG